MIERACLLSDGKMLSERDVLAAMPPAIDTPTPPVLTESAPAASASTWDPAFLTNAQRAQVEHALRESQRQQGGRGASVGHQPSIDVSVAEAPGSLPAAARTEER